MAKFIFVRHGQSQANAAGRVAKPDSLLTETGLQQARETGYKLRGMGIKTIVCSPFPRAQQTAETIAAELGIDIAHIVVIDELHERRMGKLEGTLKDHETAWYNFTIGSEGMELRPDLIKRMQQCLLKIDELSQNGLVLAVGHACSGLYLIEVAAGRSTFEEFNTNDQIDNAAILEVEISKQKEQQT
jgi:broad specificity phosphatase PhoE